MVVRFAEIWRCRRDRERIDRQVVTAVFCHPIITPFMIITDNPWRLRDGHETCVLALKPNHPMFRSVWFVSKLVALANLSAALDLLLARAFRHELAALRALSHNIILSTHTRFCGYIHAHRCEIEIIGWFALSCPSLTDHNKPYSQGNDICRPKCPTCEPVAKPCSADGTPHWRPRASIFESRSIGEGVYVHCCHLCDWYGG